MPEIINNRFEIGQEMGRGVFSVTYRALDKKENRQCVIKSIKLSDPDVKPYIEAFSLESGLLKHLKHPLIPAYIDHFFVESDDGAVLYTVREYIDGASPVDLIKEGKHFSEYEAAIVARDIVSILKYLHSFSPPIIHRDIKPSNIIIDSDGHAHLLDFDAVKHKLYEATTTVHTRWEGWSYGYTPPEQYEGKASELSDIYALGATVVYLLSHLEPADLIINEQIVFDDHINVSMQFSNILAKMTQPDTKSRYKSAAAVEADLNSVIADCSPSTNGPGILANVLWTIIVAVLCLSIAAGLYFKFNKPGRGAKTSITSNSQPIPQASPSPYIVTDSDDDYSPIVAASKSVYDVEEPIDVTYSGLKASSTDWITIVDAKAPTNTYNQWFYTSGNRSGTLKFDGLKAGNYEVRVYFDWPKGGYNMRASYPFTVFDKSKSKSTVKGSITYDGTLMNTVSDVKPTFWFRNEEKNVEETPFVDYNNGTFLIYDLPPGKIGMSVDVDSNTMNERFYPGDYKTFVTFDVNEESVSELNVRLQKIVHMTKPEDNSVEMKNWGAPCMDKVKHTSPVRFEWDSFGEDAVYYVTIDVADCLNNYNTKRDFMQMPVMKPFVVVHMPRSKDNECYIFQLIVRHGDNKIGMLMTHGSDGYGWDYRFRVAGHGR